MNVKNYFTLIGIIGILYGLFFFLIPEKAQDVYGAAEMTNEMTTNILKFLGASILAGGVAAIMARNAHMSIARKALLIYFAASFTLYLVINIMNIVNGMPTGTMNYVDMAIQIIFAGSAWYLLTKEKTAPTA